VPEPGARRVFGWREVLLVGGAIVVIVLGLSVVTSVLPSGAQWLVFQSPLLIVLIVVGTVLVLASLFRGPRVR
jgi:FtsH-binding integral membrane protein